MITITDLASRYPTYMYVTINKLYASSKWNAHLTLNLTLNKCILLRTC